MLQWAQSKIYASVRRRVRMHKCFTRSCEMYAHTNMQVCRCSSLLGGMSERAQRSVSAEECECTGTQPGADRD